MKLLVKDIVHAWLECGRSICQAKGHDNKLKVTIVAFESSLWYVFFPHLNLMIVGYKVNIWEELVSMSSSMIGMGYLFFNVFLFKALKSMHILKVPSFFLTITTEEAYGMELGIMRPNSKSYLMAYSIAYRILSGCI